MLLEFLGEIDGYEKCTMVGAVSPSVYILVIYEI